MSWSDLKPALRLLGYPFCPWRPGFSEVKRCFQGHTAATEPMPCRPPYQQPKVYNHTPCYWAPLLIWGLSVLGSGRCDPPVLTSRLEFREVGSPVHTHTARKAQGSERAGVRHIWLQTLASPVMNWEMSNLSEPCPGNRGGNNIGSAPHSRPH